MSNRDRDWNDVADLLIDYIEKRARDNRMREGYAAALSDNRWRNRTFNNLVDLIMDADREIERLYARRNDDFIDYMREAIPDLVNGHFAMSCLADRTVANDLDNKTYNEMQDARERFEDIVDPPNQRRGGRDDRGSDRGRGRNDRGGSADSYRRNWGRDDDRDDRRGGYRDDYRDRRSSNNDRPAAKDTRNAWDLVSKSQTEEREDRAPVREERREERREEVRPAPAPRQEEAPAPVRRINGPNYTQARPYDDFWQEDEHWQAAVVSNWTLTEDPEEVGFNRHLSATPSFYDVNEYVKFYARDAKGNVREELQEVTDENRYLQHQLVENPEVRKPAQSSAAISIRQLETEPAGFHPDESQTQSLQLAGLLEHVQVPKPEFNVETGLIGCIYNSRSKLAADPDEVVRADWHLVRTPLVASSWNQLELIQQVHNAGTLTGAMEKMKELKSAIDEPIWNELNKRFSNLVLRAVTFQFQLPGIKNFSFADHWPKLLDWYDKKRGATETAEFAKRASYIVALACQHIARDEIADLMADLAPQNANIPTVVFVDFLLLSSIKATADEVGIGLQLTQTTSGAKVTEQTCRTLRSTLVNLFHQADVQLPPPQRMRVYITTSDCRLIEVVPFAARQENFILASVTV